MDEKICCSKTMIKNTLEDMNGTQGEIWICPVCFSYVKEESGQLDADDVFSILQLDDSILESDVSDEEITNYILKEVKQ